MVAQLQWNSTDLDLLPENGDRYEIIAGELFVTRAPHHQHQKTCGRFFTALDNWSRLTSLGVASIGAGLIFGDNDDVIPDVMWMGTEKYQYLIDDSGHFGGAPDLAIEVLSAGKENERRDRSCKLKLYSIHGVLEYWIADWRAKQVEIYRRDRGVLQLQMTLFASDFLTSPLLPKFNCAIAEIFD
jgi:Uma2 family endonuclease